MELLASQRTVSLSSTVVTAGDLISSDLVGEVVILSLKSGKYYGLDPVGARIWGLIQEPRVVGDVRDIVMEEYEVDLDRCERDLLALLQRLAAEELIEVKDEKDP